MTVYMNNNFSSGNKCRSEQEMIAGHKESMHLLLMGYGTATRCVSVTVTHRIITHLFSLSASANMLTISYASPYGSSMIKIPRTHVTRYTNPHLYSIR